MSVPPQLSVCAQTEQRARLGGKISGFSSHYLGRKQKQTTIQSRNIPAGTGDNFFFSFRSAEPVLSRAGRLRAAGCGLRGAGTPARSSPPASSPGAFCSPSLPMGRTGEGQVLIPFPGSFFWFSLSSSSQPRMKINEPGLWKLPLSLKSISSPSSVLSPLPAWPFRCYCGEALVFTVDLRFNNNAQSPRAPVSDLKTLSPLLTVENSCNQHLLPLPVSLSFLSFPGSESRETRFLRKIPVSSTGREGEAVAADSALSKIALEMKSELSERARRCLRWGRAPRSPLRLPLGPGAAAGAAAWGGRGRESPHRGHRSSLSSSSFHFLVL